MLTESHVVICCDCRARLEYKDNYSREHIQKFPDHKRYKIVLKSDEDIN
jgi:hypothetical protein